MGDFLDKNGLTRFKEKMLTEVDKRIASGGGSTSGDDIPTKEEILEGANRVTDVEVNPEVATVEAIQTAIARIESNLNNDGAIEALQTAIASLEARMNAEAIPVGTVIAMSANSAPSGYILCDGSAISRTTYAKLFGAIGTTYGSGDGSTTFNVPNLTDRFIQGGETVGVVKEAGLPNITGKINSRTAGDGTYSGFICGGSGAFAYTKMGLSSGSSWSFSNNSTNSKTSDVTDLDASRSNAIYGKSTTVQPPALTMRYYIKY